MGDLQKLILFASVFIIFVFAASSQINTYNASDLGTDSTQKKLQIANIILLTIGILIAGAYGYLYTKNIKAQTGLSGLQPTQTGLSGLLPTQTGFSGLLPTKAE